MTTPYPKNVLTREGIITNMCYTFDHSSGAPYMNWEDLFGEGVAPPPPGIHTGIGYTDEMRKALWNQMAQIFDNDIAPYMEFKK